MTSEEDKTVMWIDKAVHGKINVLKARWQERSLSDTVARLIEKHDEVTHGNKED